MLSRGPGTVPRSHLSPENHQTLLLVKIDIEILESAVSWTHQALPGCMEWALSQKSPSLDVS